MGAAFGGLGGGPGEGRLLDWEQGLSPGGGACLGDVGGCRAPRVKPVPCIGEKEVGAAALGPGLGQKGQRRGQAAAGV